MDDFQDAIKDLKSQLSTFIKDYYIEIKNIWIKISVLENNQKWTGIIYGGVSGIIVGIISALIMKAIGLK